MTAAHGTWSCARATPTATVHTTRDFPRTQALAKFDRIWPYYKWYVLHTTYSHTSSIEKKITITNPMVAYHIILSTIFALSTRDSTSYLRTYSSLNRSKRQLPLILQHLIRARNSNHITLITPPRHNSRRRNHIAIIWQSYSNHISIT